MNFNLLFDIHCVEKTSKSAEFDRKGFNRTKVEQLLFFFNNDIDMMTQTPIDKIKFSHDCH